MDILSFKALHIVGFVAWFAGLFYLPRLFVYHIELLQEEPTPENNTLVMAHRFSAMQWKLFKIIMRPAMFLTIIGGVGMLILNTAYLSESWMHVKLALVLALVGYNHFLPRIIRQLEKGQIPMSSKKMRLFNEVPTIILVAIVLLAVFRGVLSWWKILLIILVLMLFILLASKVYHRVRNKDSHTQASPK